MANVAQGKKILAIAVLACIVAALIAVPAFAFYNVHSEENTAANNGRGAEEILVTVDASAIGEGTHAGLIFVPEGSTAEACLEEGIISSNSQNGLEAIHSYGYDSLKDYLDGKTWTCTVYNAETQKPGTQTTHDKTGTEGTSTSLNRYDNVVFTISG